MNVPAIIAIPLRVVFVVGVLAFLAVVFVVGGIYAGLRWLVDAVMDG